MSGLETAIILDGGALENLFTAGRQAAWDQLIASGRKVIIPQEVLDEIAELRDGPNKELAAKFDIWRSGKANVYVTPSLRLNDISGDAAIEALMKRDTQAARDALASAGVDSDSRFRLLTDDSPLELR